MLRKFIWTYLNIIKPNPPPQTRKTNLFEIAAEKNKNFSQFAVYCSAWRKCNQFKKKFQEARFESISKKYSNLIWWLAHCMQMTTEDFRKIRARQFPPKKAFLSSSRRWLHEATRRIRVKCLIIELFSLNWKYSLCKVC